MSLHLTSLKVPLTEKVKLKFQSISMRDSIQKTLPETGATPNDDNNASTSFCESVFVFEALILASST